MRSYVGKVDLDLVEASWEEGAWTRTTVPGSCKSGRGRQSSQECSESQMRAACMSLELLGNNIASLCSLQQREDSPWIHTLEAKALRDYVLPTKFFTVLSKENALTKALFLLLDRE